jgi:hypothetical protein
MELVYSLKMSMNFYQTSRCYILDDSSTLHIHRCESAKSNIILLITWFYQAVTLKLTRIYNLHTEFATFYA